MPSLKIIFAGTPDFAVPALKALVESSHQVCLVLTQPDRPAGRGMKLKASPVKELANEHGIAVFQPETLKDADAQARIAAEQADVMIVAAYGLIIPTVILNMPRKGCYNIPHCYRAGEVLLRYSAPCWQAIRRQGSPSWK